MRNLRIGIFVQSFPVLSETFIVTKVVGLIRQGYDVRIYTNRKSAVWNRYDFPELEQLKTNVILSASSWRKNIFLFAFHSMRIFFKKMLSNPLGVCRLVAHVSSVRKTTRINPLIQFINKLIFVGEKPDVLHIEFDFQAYGIADIKEYLKCKLVLSGRGSINRTSVVNKFSNFYFTIYKYVDHYHFISEYLHAEAIKNGLRNTTGVSLIEPAIDLSLFKPGSKSETNEDMVYLITIGRLSWAKGYEFAIDAIGQVYKQYPNIRYRILGDGDYKDAILCAIEQNGLADTGVIEFVGNVRREEVPGYLQISDIMIHAAVEEGFCNAVIEGQSMKLPVVSSDAGGLPENVENNVTGYLVSRRDSKAMAEKILYLIQNPNVRLEMGGRGRDRVLKKFDINNQLQKFHQMYQSLIAHN